MTIRTLVFFALLLGAPAVHTLAHGAACDFTLNGGTVEGGALVEGTVTTAVAADGARAAIPEGTRLRGGRISSGTLAQATSTGGKLSGKQCQGVRLVGAGITEAQISGAVTVVRDGTADETRALDTPVEVTLNAASIDNAIVTNPSALVEGKTVPPTSQADDNAPLAGDWFQFNTTVLDARAQKAPGQDKAIGLVIPANSCFRVAAEFDETNGTEKKRYARGTFAKAAVWWWPPSWLSPPFGCEIPKLEEVVRDTCKGTPGTAEYNACEAEARNRSVDIPVDTLVNTGDRYRFGFTYGVMAAPFKYYRGSKTFDAGAQIGPYIGYRVWDRQGSSTVLALGIGATSARVKVTDGSTTTEETKNGLSWAFGVFTEFKNSFNVGLLWGMDMFSAADAVPNQGAHWLSVSFGYKLSP